MKAAVSPLDAPAKLSDSARKAVAVALRARLGSSWSSVGQLAELLSVKVKPLPGWPVEVAVKDRTVAIAAGLAAPAERQAISRGLAIVVLQDAAVAFTDADVNPFADALLAAEAHPAEATS